MTIHLHPAMGQKTNHKALIVLCKQHQLNAFDLLSGKGCKGSYPPKKAAHRQQPVNGPFGGGAA